MPYTHLKELIDHFAQFEQETGAQDMAGFGRWLVQRTTDPKGEFPAADAFGEPIESKITREMGRLTSFVKHYIKKATKDSPLAGWNDMVAIIVLFYGGDRRKTELIQMSLMELSPGMEVVRRLLRLGLIEDFPDPDDGRARRVQLTPQGRMMYQTLEKEIQKVSQIVVGNLSSAEKQQLLVLLEKLGHFHMPIWLEDGDSELDSILGKYIARNQAE